MKKKLLEDALSQVGDDHIREAATYKKRRLAPWFGAVAAVLALAIALGIFWPGRTKETPPQANPGVYTLCAPNYPILSPYPADEADYEAYTKWADSQKALRAPEGYADSLDGYFDRTLSLLLGKAEGQNKVYSPLSIYLALAMLAEITGGETKAQILALLGAADQAALRTQASQVWKAHYHDDGLSTCILGSSLWLSDNYSYIEQTAQTLADDYFASVFRGDLGSDEMNEALRAWLSQQTGGLLDAYIEDIKMEPLTVLALASTVYYQVQWTEAFREENNTQAVFHAPGGDRTETFLNRSSTTAAYYEPEDFQVTGLYLEDRSTMWLFLPEEGTTPEALMAGGQPWAFLTGEKDPEGVTLNLSLPKFDISADTDLVEDLKSLGITRVFDSTADFSPLLKEEDGGYVSQVRHAARVAIDEEGVTAAAYTLILRDGSSMPPPREVDLVFDRPFAFVIQSRDGLVLFAGIVNEP